MNRLLYCIFFGIFLSTTSYAQLPYDRVFKARVFEGDTMPMMSLPEVHIKGYMIYRSPSEQRRYDRLVRNVKKVYPYARLAGIKLREYDVMMAGLTEKEQKKIYKRAEEDLKDEFGEELKKLTITQGHILLKLIDREVGNPTYDIVKDLRGRFVAFFWQNLSRIFGYNLKDKYDPAGRDRDIEIIVQRIENGSI